MKCKYCGGDVALENHFCPHCGRPVEQAVRHQKEMEQYEAKFERTRQQAIDQIQVSSGGGTAVGIRLAVIVAMIAALIFMAVNLDGYSMNQRREKRAAKANHDAYVEEIENCLEERDYVKLSVFCDKHELEFNDDFKEYRYIVYGADSFKSIYRGLLDAAFCTEDTRQLYYAENLSRNVNSFYELITRDISYADDTEKTLKVYDGMEEEMLTLMRRYLGLSREETDSMRGLSKSRRTVLIEQALDARITTITGKSLSEMKESSLPALEENTGAETDEGTEEGTE